MSELREKDLRWQIAFEITTGDLDGKSSGEIADNILSLLPSPAMSGVLSIKKCNEDHTETGRHYPCHLCADTGEITRELTEHELAEALKSILKAYPGWRTFPNGIALPTGETLRLKKEK